MAALVAFLLYDDAAFKSCASTAACWRMCRRTPRVATAAPRGLPAHRRSGRGAALLMDMLLNPLDRRHRLRHDVPVVPGAFPLVGHLPAIVCDLRAHAAPTGLINDMVSAFDRSDDALSDDVLVANIRLLLLAGHDTTASTMAWMVIELALQPVLWDALVEEAQRVGAVPTRHADLAQYPVAEALFRETLRNARPNRRCSVPIQRHQS
ncbi:cytochrome P450 [Bradyrhizobium sp. LB7.1]